MKFMKPVLMIAMLGGIVLEAAAQDQCKPIGWATRDGRTGGVASVTGGGSATPIVVKTFADLQKYVQDDQPRVLYVSGTLGTGWSGTDGDRLEIKASNKTVIGVVAGTVLKAPIHITNSAKNVIVRNLVINGPGSNQLQAWDNLNIEGGAKNVWIDHCEFWDGQDGNADVVKGADNVTFTWCIFGYKIKSDHNLSNLIGGSDNEPVSEGKLNVTYMFNWWKAATQRKPRCRYGNVHVVNNLLSGDPAVQSGTILGISAGKDCQVRTENNHFVDESTPIYTGNAAGTSSQEVIDNLFTNCTGNQKGTGTSFTPPYEYKPFMVAASKVKDLVQKYAGATLASPTSCSANPTGIGPEAVSEGVSGLFQDRQELVIEGFAERTVEVSVLDLSGSELHRWTLVSSGLRRRIDLATLGMRPGLYVAVARIAGQAVVTTAVHLLR